MSAVQNAIEHWSHVAPLLTEPTSEADYDRLARALDDVLDQIGEDERHPLSGLASRIGDVIRTYDEQHRPLPDATGVEALRYLMQEHGLTQSNFPEVGTQSVVSEILSGRRRLNVRQVAALADRFSLPEAVFIDRDQRDPHIAVRKPNDLVKKTGRRRKKLVRRSASRGQSFA